MASTNLYINRTKTATENLDGGYKNVVQWAPRDTFLSIKTPLAIPLALGDKYKITTTHTFVTSDEGWISELSKFDGVTITGETVGDEGANFMEWTAKFVILGDGASTQEQVTDKLNADNIFLLKDANCLTGAPLVQIGDECNSPLVKVSFDGKNSKGLKEYSVEIKSRRKFFYSGTVTAKP